MRQLLVTPQFEKDVQRLPESVKRSADETIASLRINPLDSALHVRKLKELDEYLWRARVGNYRLIYSFNETSLILHRLRHRKDVYRNL